MAWHVNVSQFLIQKLMMVYFSILIIFLDFWPSCLGDCLAASESPQHPDHAGTAVFHKSLSGEVRVTFLFYKYPQGTRLQKHMPSLCTFVDIFVGYLFFSPL